MVKSYPHHKHSYVHIYVYIKFSICIACNINENAEERKEILKPSRLGSIRGHRGMGMNAFHLSSREARIL